MEIVKTLSQIPKILLEHIKKSVKSVHFYLTLAAAVCTIIGLFLYLSIDGTSAYLKEISDTAVALYAVGFALTLVVLLVPFKMAYILVFCITLCAPLVYLTSQASFIVNVFVAIDGQSFSAAFILAALFPLISAGLIMASCVLVKEPALFAENKAEAVVNTHAAEEAENTVTEETQQINTSEEAE